MTAKQMNFHAELKMMHQINHCVNETHKYEQPALSGWNENSQFDNEMLPLKKKICDIFGIFL